MKESWLYYDYLRRWWKILVIGVFFGAFMGIAYYSSQTHGIAYSGTAKIGVYEVVPGIYTPPQVKTSFDVELGSWPSQEGAIEYASSTALEIALVTGSPTVVQQVSLAKSTAGAQLWKVIVLGSTIGFLLAIGIAYVRDDARAYREHLESQA